MIELAPLAARAARLAVAPGDDPTSSVANPILQLGAIGAVTLLAFYLSWWLIKDLRAQRDGERARAERAEASTNALNEEVRREVVPALVRATEALARLADDRRRDDRR